MTEYVSFLCFSVIITIITFIRNISVIPMMSSSRVNNHTCVSMRYGSIRLIISVGRGLCTCFVSNIQIYGCLKKRECTQFLCKCLTPNHADVSTLLVSVKFNLKKKICII